MTESTDLCSDVTVVIRAAGERTEALCEQLVLQQVARKNVIVIHERPFNKALEVGYEIGIDKALDWTLFVDADVVLGRTAISRLLTLSSVLGKDTLGIQARVLDKFFGGDRTVGHHLYRTCLLDKARALIPELGQAHRPETYVMRQMAARGHDYYLAKDVIALHDYEQFYRDIYRTMVVQARKSWHHGHHVPYLLSRAISLLTDDLDYKIVAHGLCAGLWEEGPLVLDASARIEEADSLLQECGIEEKAPLDVDARMNYADEVLTAYVPSKAYQEYTSQHWQGLMDPKVKPFVRTKDRLLELGALRAVPWGVGRMLQLAGSILVRWSERK